MSIPSSSGWIESARLIAQVAAADRTARVLVTACDACSDAGRPLSARQRVELIRSALLEFDGFNVELTGLLELEGRLGELSPNGQP
jgi:hypothetical protein